MGTIIQIEQEYVTVKFDDGNIRKYLKENFVYEPRLNRRVSLNNYGMLVDVESQKESEHNKNIFIVVLVVIIGGFLFYCFISTAIGFGNAVESCIDNCDSGTLENCD